MNEEKLTLKREKSNKAGQAKGGKPKEKSAEQAMANELSETQSTFEPGGNLNVTFANWDWALHEASRTKLQPEGESQELPHDQEQQLLEPR